METITVLVVDNETDSDKTLKDGLSDVGFNVLTTNRELDGLEELQYGTNIDVVLLDYNAPTLDRSQTLEQLNNQFPKAKAIGMTRSNTAKLANMYRNDVEKLLPAPTTISDLVAAIHSVLGIPTDIPADIPVADARVAALGRIYWMKLIESTILFLVCSYAILRVFRYLINTALFSN